MYYSLKKDKGFALVFAMGVGFVLTVVGLSILLKGHHDQTVSISQNQKAKSLNIAETGITRITAFFNGNKPLLTFNKSEWQSYLNNATDSRTQALKKRFEGCKVSTELQSQKAYLQFLVNGDWITLNDGEYRLVDYTFYSTSGGVLIVQGRLKDYPEAMTNLKVSFNISLQKQTGTLPGVWLTNDSDGTGNFNSTNGNKFQTKRIWFNRCITDPQFLTSETLRLVDPQPTPNSNSAKAEYTSLDLPPLPTLNLSRIPAEQRFITINDNLTLPRETDDFEDVTSVVNGNPTTIRTYRYLVGDIDIPNSKKLTINTVEDNYTVVIDAKGNRVRSYTIPRTPRRIQVVFYLTGSISKGGDIEHPCTSSLCKPTDFQIYGYGANGQSDFGIPDVFIQPPSICANGNQKFQAFILAPGYRFGVEGGGLDGGFSGAVWGAQWDNNMGCGSNANKIIFDQQGTWEDLIPNFGLVDNPQPTLGSITKFEDGDSQ